MTSLAFDHLVHFSSNPESAKNTMLQHGIQVIEGGKHENWGTYNTLAYFGLSYIEWLGIQDRSVSIQVDDNPLIQQLVAELPLGDHPGRIALRTNNMDQLAADLKEKGLKLHGPVKGSRLTDSGELLQWSMLFIAEEHSTLPLPFFIQWGEDDAGRREKLKVPSSHPAGSLEIKDVLFAVEDLDNTISSWSYLFDLQIGEAYINEEWGAKCQRLYLPHGNLLFCTPVGDDFIKDFLDDFGERPFGLQLENGQQNRSILLQGGMYEITKE
ncbi:VOC family protein [Rossellomorea vietnamensis]|uniref:VOC family protein n=1 Tax=Rossellomorea vietnamensis TaxID=218284 RepID=A0A5D4K5K4_9BACI|nr:VOC family protein [Rossellomorea vietnamensis]TYR72657.1 VOC family protein [Rossellomorea vietnamensis]